jgi:hypothetical protein
MEALKWVLIVADLLYIFFALNPWIWWEKYWNLFRRNNVKKKWF